MVVIGSGTAVQKSFLNLYLRERVKVINVCITFLMFQERKLAHWILGFEYKYFGDHIFCFSWR